MELIVKIEKGVCEIKLNRPEVFNSFNKKMALKLQDVLNKCENDDNVRVIVLTGEGKAFCAGQDLAEATDPEGPDLRSIVRDHYNPIIEKIRKIEKPVIAAVNGVAAGAGANIALACDIVVSSEHGSFIQAFSKIGLIPDSAGTFFLPRIIGFQKASALMMLGDKIVAEEALQMGLIYKIFPTSFFNEDVMTLAITLAKMPTKALGLTKRLLNQSMTNNLEQQMALESDLQIEASSSNDYKEGVTAFVEKRIPEFKGN
jgi:2-(1,2-epoxy-1,2-dihydrophenyl)acetyl-CoA isomerase